MSVSISNWHLLFLLTRFSDAVRTTILSEKAFWYGSFLPTNLFEACSCDQATGLRLFDCNDFLQALSTFGANVLTDESSDGEKTMFVLSWRIRLVLSCFKIRLYSLSLQSESVRISILAFKMFLLRLPLRQWALYPTASLCLLSDECFDDLSSAFVWPLNASLRALTCRSWPCRRCCSKSWFWRPACWSGRCRAPLATSDTLQRQRAENTSSLHRLCCAGVCCCLTTHGRRYQLQPCLITWLRLAWFCFCVSSGLPDTFCWFCLCVADWIRATLDRSFWIRFCEE